MAKKQSRSSDVHVVPDSVGWKSTKGGRALRLFATQAEAIGSARREAIRLGKDLIVHDKRGQIRDALSFDRFEGTRMVKPAVTAGARPKLAYKRAVIRAKKK